jgi:hypothetical protein
MMMVFQMQRDNMARMMQMMMLALGKNPIPSSLPPPKRNDAEDDSGL